MGLGATRSGDRTRGDAFGERTRELVAAGDERERACDEARVLGFRSWVQRGNFTADREPVDFGEWKAIGELYREIPDDPSELALGKGKNLDVAVQKPSQAGASIWAILLVLWLALRWPRMQAGYFLPDAKLAAKFSLRFIRIVRENPSIYRLMGRPPSTIDGLRALRAEIRRAVREGSAVLRMIGESGVNFATIGSKGATEGLPLDALVFDEVQLMAIAAIERAYERIESSRLKVNIKASTANMPGADINYFFERSDQREFFTRCGCAEGVVLSDHFDPKLGPLCIGVGNGSTPGVPREPHWRCPRCTKVIVDPQDGRFRPRNPGHRRRGYHWGQYLSPRQTAAAMLEAWDTRIDTKNYFNRKLGLTYADPNTLPVNESHLRAASERGVGLQLQWKVPERRTVDGIFMGIDQMGQDCHVVIAARVEGMIRLCHLEIVQSDDPFERCAELMRLFRVRHCAVEGLPNFNDAQRFAKRFEGHVFVVHYADHADEILTWGDRPKDRVLVRHSDEDIKTRYTASVDQFKMMDWALAKWANGEVETPDARAISQRLRTEQGIRQVELCLDAKLGLWTHLQRVALVTLMPEGKGKEDERKPRRAVRKVGLDPHWAFSWMLMCVAFVRAYGTERMLRIDTEDDVGPQPVDSGEMAQVRTAFADKLESSDVKLGLLGEAFAGTKLCGNCKLFDGELSRCKLRHLYVPASMVACARWEELPKPDDDEQDWDDPDEELWNGDDEDE